MAILLTIAAPSFNSFFDKKRLVAGTEAIYGELQFARIEALSATANLNTAATGGILVKFHRDADDDWLLGTSVNAACDPDAGTNCYIIKDDGDGTVDGVDVDLDGVLDAGETDAGDRVTKILNSVDYEGAHMTATPSFVGTTTGPEITFDSVRGTTANARQGTIFMQSVNGLQMRVTVGVLGQISLCSPAGVTTKVNGYPDC